MFAPSAPVSGRREGRASLSFFSPEWAARSWNGRTISQCLPPALVYAFDMLGHGLTDKPQKTVTRLPISRVSLWPSCRRRAKPAPHFIGNSLGGRIALECARLAPTRVKSMVIAAPAGIGRETALTMHLRVCPSFGKLFGLVRAE